MQDFISFSSLTFVFPLKIFPHSCFVMLCRVCWDRGHLGLLLFLSVFLCDFCCRFLLLFCLLRRNVFGFPVVHPRFLMECSFCFSLFFSSIRFPYIIRQFFFLFFILKTKYCFFRICIYVGICIYVSRKMFQCSS